MISRVVVYKDDRLDVVAHFDDMSPAEYRGLVFTFDALVDSSQANANYGFGGKYLLSKGFVVFSIVDKKKVWYQNLNPLFLDAINNFIDESIFRDLKRYSYGSSMGGFGALLFAQQLNIDLVLALSPQYSIWEDWDKTWKSYADLVETPVIPNFSIFYSKGITVVIAVDSFHKDGLHAEKIKQSMSGDNCHVINFRYAGHPVSAFLSEIDKLKSLVDEVFLNGRYDNFSIARQDAHKSPSYRFNLASKLRAKGKIGLAIKVLKSTISPSFNTGVAYEIHRLLCILQKESKSADLEETVARACQIFPSFSDRFSKFLNT